MRGLDLPPVVHNLAFRRNERLCHIQTCTITLAVTQHYEHARLLYCVLNPVHLGRVLDEGVVHVLVDHWDILYFQISNPSYSISIRSIPITEVVQIPLDVPRMKSVMIVLARGRHIPRIAGNPYLGKPEDLDSLLRALSDQSYCLVYAPL
jgi:hypothetical protein